MVYLHAPFTAHQMPRRGASLQTLHLERVVTASHRVIPNPGMQVIHATAHA
jgi:hypothetical protein